MKKLPPTTPLSMTPGMPPAVTGAVQDWFTHQYPTANRAVTLRDLSKLSAHQLMEDMNVSGYHPAYIGPNKLTQVRDVLALHGLTLRYDPPLEQRSATSDRELALAKARLRRIERELRTAREAIANALNATTGGGVTVLRKKAANQ